MMEIRFPGRGRNTRGKVAGKGEIYSYNQSGNEMYALVRLADRSFVTARIPTNMECPDIGMTVEVMHRPQQTLIRASAGL